MPESTWPMAIDTIDNDPRERIRGSQTSEVAQERQQKSYLTGLTCLAGKYRLQPQIYLYIYIDLQ